MTAAIDYQMPKIVQICKAQEFASGSSELELEPSIEDLLKKARRGKVSISHNLSDENTVFEQNYIASSFHEIGHVILPKTYLSNLLLKKPSAVFPDLEDKQEEIEEAFLRGIQPINHQHKVLFTQKVQIKTSELKRRRPNIVINPSIFEDDE